MAILVFTTYIAADTGLLSYLACSIISICHKLVNSTAHLKSPKKIGKDGMTDKGHSSKASYFGPGSSSKTGKSIFKVERYNAVALWSWGMYDPLEFS